MSDQISRILRALCVAAGAGFLILALVLIFLGCYVTAMVAVLSSVFCFPTTRERIESLRDRELPKLKLTMWLVLAATLSGWMVESTLEDGAKAKQRAAAVEAAKQEQEARNQSFLENPKTVANVIAQKLQGREFEQARKELNKYTLTDPRLEGLKLDVRRAELREKLAGIAATTVSEERFTTLSELAQLSPGDAALRAELDELKPKLEAFRASLKADEDARKAAAEKQARIEAQFSGWDGSHLKVERAIKERMNNPDSYKHVKTTYRITKTGLLVATQFRGTNAFGGVVMNTAIAETDEAGNVLSLAIQ